MTTALFAAPTNSWSAYEAPLHKAFAAQGLDVDLVTEADPATVDYVIYAPSGGTLDFTPYTNVKAVLSLWAGVESIVTSESLTMPLCRMVDHGLTEGMVEWVTGHALRHHLGMDTHIHGQDGVWRIEQVPPLARHRKVCVLGLGALGAACAQMLAQLNFETHGWSRRLKDVEGVICHAGDDGLIDALTGAEIVVLLLPLTAETENVLNADRLALLSEQSFIINPGRGPLIDDQALLAALDSGQVAHATLDVFREEPLPVDHAYWAHPNVTVTPHIASATREDTASEVIAENIRRGEAGESFLHLVDRAAGY